MEREWKRGGIDGSRNFFSLEQSYDLIPHGPFIYLTSRNEEARVWRGGGVQGARPQAELGWDRQGLKIYKFTF